MKRMMWSGLALLAAIVLVAPGAAGWLPTASAQARPAAGNQTPQFQIGPAWPTLPSKWVLGPVTSLAVDSQDHVWILHRPRAIEPEQKERAAPAVLEFDASGKFIQAWGGPGAGYEWPAVEHGIFVDHKGNVWIAGNQKEDNQILKFSRNGKFLMQIGRAGQSKGNADTQNVHAPANVFVYAKTNEAFVADGYQNRRVIVFDADTGAYKRMWGAFGNVPVDGPPTRLADGGRGPEQFNVIHTARVSNDGLVYVTDRNNRRVQVFTVDGKYVTQVFINRVKAPPSTLTGMRFGRPARELADELANAGTASGTAFSPDPEQRFLYVMDRSTETIHILDRKRLEKKGEFGGGIGSAPGQFYILHDIAVDSKGNVYTAEVNEIGNKRAQKFLFKGMGTAGTQ